MGKTVLIYLVLKPMNSGISCQYHGCWWLDCLRRQNISKHTYQWCVSFHYPSRLRSMVTFDVSLLIADWNVDASVYFIFPEIKCWIYLFVSSHNINIDGGGDVGCYCVIVSFVCRDINEQRNSLGRQASCLVCIVMQIWLMISIWFLK